MSEHFGARAYVLEGWVAAVKGALAFLATPALGSLSDLVGRKRILIVCLAVSGLGWNQRPPVSRRGLPSGPPVSGAART